VRLNPVIPWKTRGNGAVCIRLSKQYDRENFHIGYNEHSEPLEGYLPIPKKAKVPDESDSELLEASVRLENIIASTASLADPTTNPGLVIAKAPIPIELYWSAVRSVVKLSEIKNALSSLGILFKGFKKGRGIIGASAAIAWASNVRINPKPGSKSKSSRKLDYTYEIITYRSKSRWGTKREVNSETVREIDRKFPSTFNNYDYENGHIAITPNSPCPVLLGIRGDSVSDLHGAVALFSKSNSTETIDKSLIFVTNQGTDDHLVPTSVKEVKPYTSVLVTGMISQEPYSITGGHVFFNLAELDSENLNKSEQKVDNPGQTQMLVSNVLPTSTTRITCAAYEPTKGFRNTVRDLCPGDIVSVYGSVRPEPKTINIEKLAVDTVANKLIKIHNPKCPACGRAMKSIGYLKGYRCRKCHTSIGLDSITQIQVHRTLQPGIYEVPVCARRHLAKPIKRM
jgi:tRNA(Ile2)-agmatinylcytidine synthase